MRGLVLPPFLALLLGACRGSSKGGTAALDTLPPIAAPTPAPAVQESTRVVCPSRLPKFTDYPVDSVFHGKPVWPVITLGPDSLDMQRRLDYALAHARGSGPSFAGYLKVIETGCGSPCQNQTFVDVRSGHVLNGENTSLGAAYRVNSRLFIANPMDSTACYNPECTYCRPIYYLWNGSRLDSIW